MFSKYLYFGILTVIFLLLQGSACFFVKHVNRRMCLNVTGIILKEESWGNLSYVGLTNKCLDPTVQNQFLDNSAMRNLVTKGCFEGTARAGNGYNLPMLYLLRTKRPQDNCRNRDQVATQSAWGGFSIHNFNSKTTQCAVPATDSRITKQGVDLYIGLENCADKEDQRFNFGSVTCSGNAINNANCPPNQYMVVKTASYRRLSPTEKCGSSNDSDCEVNVTCRLKKQCDGQRQCTITVNDNLFSGDQCPGSTKYLYFEYQCSDKAMSFNNLCGVPEGPPLNVTVTAESSSSLSVTWEPPEKNKRNGMIVNYTVCVSHEENKPCFKNETTKEKILVIGSLNVSTKYYICVLASTKVGRGPFSESKGEFTNGKQPEKANNRTETTLTFSLQIPSHNFMYFYVVALELKEGKQNQPPASYKNNELLTYSETESTNPTPYIAAILTSKDENMFILGDGRYTNIPTSRRRRSTSSCFYNGPLKPGTSYSIFQRIFIDNENYYSTDWSSPSTTVSEPVKETPSGSELDDRAKDDKKFKYLVGIIVVVVLLVISLAIIAYLTYQNRYLSNQNRRLKSSKENRESKRKNRNNSKDIYENPDKIEADANYEDVESEQSTYTALKRTGKDESDYHLYAHLNKEHKDYENQKETGM